MKFMPDSVECDFPLMSVMNNGNIFMIYNLFGKIRVIVLVKDTYVPGCDTEIQDIGSEFQYDIKAVGNTGYVVVNTFNSIDGNKVVGYMVDGLSCQVLRQKQVISEYPAKMSLKIAMNEDVNTVYVGIGYYV